MNEKKKTLHEKKLSETNTQIKPKLVKKSTKLTEKDIKLEEDLFNTTNEESNKMNVAYSSTKAKSRKINELNFASTPKTGTKQSTLDKSNAYKTVSNIVTNQKKEGGTKNKFGVKISGNSDSNKSVVSGNVSSMNSLNQIKVSNPQLDTKDQSKLNSLSNLVGNPQFTLVVNNLDSFVVAKRKENLSSAILKLQSLESSEFFCKLTSIKSAMNTFINYKDEDFIECSEVMLRYIETVTTQINSKLNDINTKSLVNDDGNDLLMLSQENDAIAINHDTNSYTEEIKNNFSDDDLIDYIHAKSTSVAFEIPVRRSRAMSDNDEKLKKKENTYLHKKFINKARLSSEEVESRMKEKNTTAERNKNNKKSIYFENINRIMSKINDIKQKKKMEKQENLKKISDKLEAYNQRHQQFLIEKTQKAKHEQQKVREINFLHRMDKENRDLNIIKKFNFSIERREQYIRKKMNVTQDRKLKGEAVQEAVKKKNILNEQLRNKVLDKFQKYSIKKEEEKLLSVDDKIDIVVKKKIQIEDQIEFLKNVYSENFIWDLVEADYFDVEDLYSLTSITKFEIVKAKLKKDKEKIEKLLDKENRSKLSPKNKTDTTFSNSNDEFAKIFIDNDEEFLYDENSDENSPKIKRSKSFTIFNEDDFLDIDYLFKDNSNKKKKRKKKKKPEVMKNKLIKTISSMSQVDFTNFFHKMNKDKKMKKFLIKNKSGNYVKSKIIIKNEHVEMNKYLITKNKTELLNTLSTHIDCNSEHIDERININSNQEENENNGENIYKADGSIPHQMSDDKKEKLIKSFLQSSDLNKADGNSAMTILINSESLSNILEKNAITVKWCKLCNLILPNDQDVNNHISRLEHKKLKNEYGITLQDDSNMIMVFQSLPGDITEDLKNERINAIKLRFKKIKQKLSLKAVKHENFWSYKQDFPSGNKQRIQKISFDIEKQTLPNIKDYDSLESNLKDLIKILEQKKQNDLHIMRGLKIIHCLAEILKKPAVCPKSEIKSLGKNLELVVKVLMYFSSIIENRNYMVVTNRMTVIADLLLWVLNKPSKIPLGISFLPDLIHLIIIHIKHRIPFEYLSMKDDFVEYLFLSNILVKFRQKYTSLQGPIDLTSGFGSFPLVLLKSLGMIEALASQLNINYCYKPVYVKNAKISENILFVLEYTELVGILQLLATLLLSNGPVKPKSDNAKSIILPQTVVSASILGVKILNNIARLDLSMFQSVINNPLSNENAYHILNYIINYSLEYLDTSDDLKELLHETILLINYISLLNEKFQNILAKGEITLIQRMCSLPFSYFCENKLKDIFFPTLISITYNNERNVEILSKEINLELLIIFLKEKIQLEPIEEEELDKLDESREENNLMGVGNIATDLFINPININTDINIVGLKKRRMSFSSTASSSKSCHDMLTGVSEFILLYHRFPRNLWETALNFYLNFGKI